MPNRLIDETSPYLLQHAHNPVDWYPWGPEALQKAQDEEKPILLSVGYSACHWCHVMEHESFSDERIAARMNTFFVNIKVDREERPDVDELYMRAVQAFNQGRGGWPMTVFLTPDGQPFFGGTYFPPVARGDMPGFVDILTRMSDLWRRNRGDVERITIEVQRLLERTGGMPRAEGALTRDWLEPVAVASRQVFDPVHGGFGGAPKFPPHGPLAVLLAHFRATGDERSLSMVTRTLDAMARGGMYDLLAGGFARYSVDDAWRIPHFEKMLYDTAQLVPLYVDGWKITHDAHYARIARESLAWVRAEMLLDHGGFAASLDADSEGAEGRFYSWTPDQVRDALAGASVDPERVCRLLEVSEHGSFEHGTSVLRLETPLERLDDGDREALERALPLLEAARAERVRPSRDDKIVTSWNAMMVSAFARAGAAFGDDALAAVGRRAARFLLDELTVDGRLMRTFKDGRAHVPAYADDHANLVLALLDLYGCDHDPAWLDEALSWADRLIDLFWDEDAGGLFFTGSDQPALVQRSKHLMGGAEPSANESAALAFVRLAKLCGRDDLQQRADTILRSMQVQLRDAPRAFGPGALAGAWSAGGGREIAIVGDPDAPDTRALLEVVRTTYVPLSVVVAVRPDQDTARWPWLEGKEAVDGAPTAWVCEGFTCLLPTSDPAVLSEQLDEVTTGPTTAAAPTGARVHAPALPDDPDRWLGTDVPLTLDRLRGQVVVLDFWTYCCINCLHVLPELGAIEDRFEGQPVAVVGVHSAKFDAEKQRSSVLRAMQRHDVRHPVVLDPDHALWSQYAVRSWPTVIVLDPTGRIAWQQSGEVDRDELAEIVEGLLDEGREAETLGDPIPVDHVPHDEGEALRFPGRVRVWPDAQEQELGAVAWEGGRVYVADTGHHRILECTLYVGDDGWPGLHLDRAFGTGEPGLVDGDAGEARFRGPQGIVRHHDQLYVADTENHALRAIDLSTGAVRTLAGTGRRGRGTPSKEDLRDPLALDLRSPWDVEVMPLREGVLVYIAMAGSHQVWVYGAGHLGIFAGSGLEEHIDGPAAGAALAQPSALAMFGRYLLLADSEVSSIRGVDLQTHQVVTVVGKGLFDFGDVDGVGDEVRMQHPLGLTFADDQLYVADTFNHKIKRISLASLETVTLAGGNPEILCEPGGIGRAGDYLLVADTNNHRLRAVHRHTGEIRDLPIR